MSLNTITIFSLHRLDEPNDYPQQHSYADAVKAYEQAEIYTNLGFEVTAPKSLDGETFTFTVTQ